MNIFRHFVTGAFLAISLCCVGTSSRDAMRSSPTNGPWAATAISDSQQKVLEFGFHLKQVTATTWETTSFSVQTPGTCFSDRSFIMATADGPVSPAMQMNIDIWPDATKSGTHFAAKVKFDTYLINATGTYSISNASAGCSDSVGRLNMQYLIP